MTNPVQVTWEHPDPNTWELQGRNNGPDDISDMAVVKVPGGFIGGYPRPLAVDETHNFKITSTDPGPIAHYVLYYTVGTDRFSCDNDTGEVLGPL